MSLIDHIPTQAEIAARRARMGMPMHAAPNFDLVAKRVPKAKTLPSPDMAVPSIERASDILRAAAEDRRERESVYLVKRDRLIERFAARLAKIMPSEMDAQFFAFLNEARDAHDKGLIDKGLKQRPNYRDAMATVKRVAEKHNVTVELLLHGGRRQKVLDARREAIGDICISHWHWSLPMVARFFGGRDHTTILHSVMCEADRRGICIRGWFPDEARVVLGQRRAASLASVTARNAERSRLSKVPAP